MSEPKNISLLFLFYHDSIAENKIGINKDSSSDKVELNLKNM
ncbi:hypothetical protein [Leptospira bouyouniensis]|nr:hypothetical protein [Leptospira bouyouniensis]